MKTIEWIDVRPFLIKVQQGMCNHKEDAEFHDWLITLCPAIWVQIDPERLTLPEYDKIKRMAKEDPWFRVDNWGHAGQLIHNYISFYKPTPSGRYNSGESGELPIELTHRIVALKDAPHPKEFFTELPEAIKYKGAEI